ncbi:MAG TPA: DUF1573 domain-containing protein [Bacteroidia bacterium]|jgi:hypothetical protein|nr:DUF1573 domain-containing protein [Bacteroidia bacterium]
MTKKGIIAFLFVLSAGFCFGQIPAPQGTQPAAVAPDPNAPDMNFQVTEHDFGTIEQDDNGTFLFLFKNVGKEPLVIKEAHGSCGCTVPKWPHKPVNPGDMDTLKVTYDTHRVGVFVKTVTITSNAKESPKVLTIKGKVLAKDSYPAFPTNSDNAGGVPYTNNSDK